MLLAGGAIPVGLVEILIILIVVFGPGIVNIFKWAAEVKKRAGENARRRAANAPPAAAGVPPEPTAAPLPREARYEAPPFEAPPPPQPVVVLEAPPPPRKKKQKRRGPSGERASAGASAIAAFPAMPKPRPERQTLGQAMGEGRPEGGAAATIFPPHVAAGLTEAQRLFLGSEIFAPPLALRGGRRAVVPVRPIPGGDGRGS